ncbi:subtilisin-like protein [Stemphylium lycopersici]|uniref:Subtilisin-like protein n=1 Tax=Stemphylium lycopersici TaxID=183478 RepID=A0A364N1M2_STELY|nr:subtilisin-like protein [Stemphylium lycopersici]RAR09389.1 subtilisin-like protein [Stemphylium lycopersici]
MQFFTRITALVATAAPFLAYAAPVAAPPANEVIPGKYIVQLKPDTDVASIVAHHNKVRSIHARNLARRGDAGPSGSPVEREYGFGDFKAYSGSFDEATIEELKALPEVLTIEQDFIMKISGLVTQTDAPWGLASISSRTTGATSYVYDDSAGDGTFSYVMDTGVRITHNEFEGRAIWGFNAVQGSEDTDTEGHGTHVAGTVGGVTYGVAKKTTIISVKVMGGSTGSASDVFAGLDWTVNDIVSKGRENTAVINMSIGSTGSTTWDAAITAAWAKGVLLTVSAGNENDAAINYSPCRSPEAICVGNVEIDNERHSGGGGSNYGPPVDIFAAGTNIISASYLSDSGTAIHTGTSMASPHVAGLVSYLRALEGPSTAAEVKARVYALATPDVVTDTLGSVNLLAYNGNNMSSRV